ncbi:F-box/kelch-repeat protein At1g57790-like [Magnolia sinica]|uniref:F-box/kelch-repeat protein At1g57790-like n=1 Tax=Magnolia sinica TaxID=86752 RepID=UPI00265971D5|nr:F-box/kelch-repeat protein At1g57790-like [Magnolia sinica]
MKALKGLKILISYVREMKALRGLKILISYVREMKALRGLKIARQTPQFPLVVKQEGCKDMKDVETYRDWASLPTELLEHIIDRLPLIEYLTFRGVCKSWRSASSDYSPKNQPKAHRPWILFFSPTSPTKCFLYNEPSESYYNIEIPELQNSSCLASNHGWLLIHHDGSLFFFNPFSRTKVELPEFKHSPISDHVATFSSPPTSEDCMVFLVSRSDPKTFEINTCRRGENEWTTICCSQKQSNLNAITGAVFSEGEFYYFDSDKRVGTYCAEDRLFDIYEIVKHGSSSSRCLPFYIWRNHFGNMALGKCIGLNIKDLLMKFGERRISISVCGTTIPHRNSEVCIANERMEYDMEDANEENKRRFINAVWIDPQFIQLSPNYRWSS